MGTNYYLETYYCPCCGKPRKTEHLGKSSIGWKFLFHKTDRIKDFKSFCDFIKEGEVKDEYGRTIDKKKLVELIESKQKDKSHIPEEAIIIDNYDFCDEDFC